MRVAWSRVVLGLAVLVGTPSGPARAAKALPCADYISGPGPDAAPLSGWLTGTSTVTLELQVKPGGIGTGITETFEVGYYRMSDGTTLRIDCRTYTEYAL
ncbi:MAG: hypothetical protein L0271_10675 [Gemmatimonadetes bacterium]|nr:hypothetical protein [Gemmatimonadota bacterium]